VVVLYDTMWGATRKMAMAAIARGVERKGLGARLINIGKSDRSDVMVEIFKARAVVLGSSTINRGLLADAAAVLEMMRGLRFKGKIGAAFGSYGWSGESPKVIEERLAEAGVELVAEALRVKYDPTEEDLRACESLGEKVADRISA
jgi:flavorubredoxin